MTEPVTEQVEVPLEPSDCLEYGDECEGEVEYFTTNGVKWWPRCQHHGHARLDRYENSIEKWADSTSPPSWFDPAYAGESWDEDY